jgi:hypothetical protein
MSSIAKLLAAVALAVTLATCRVDRSSARVAPAALADVGGDSRVSDAEVLDPPGRELSAIDAPREVVALLAPEPPRKLEGRIIDASGAPLAHSLVRLLHRGAASSAPAESEAASDVEGRFELTCRATDSVPQFDIELWHRLCEPCRVPAADGFNEIRMARSPSSVCPPGSCARSPPAFADISEPS